MEDQLCVRIDIAEMEEEGAERAQRVRNRRYKKLRELRESGFFSENAIKLRHVHRIAFSHFSIITTLESIPIETPPPLLPKPPFLSFSRRIF